jgi:hypothetical protein
MRHTFHAAAFAAFAIPALLFTTQASAQSITGSWEASVATRVSNEGGESVESNFVPISFTIEQRGDSIFAKWLRGAAEGIPAAPLRIYKGTFKDGTAILVTEPVEAKMNRNGEESTVKMVTTYTLKLQGDELVGTQSAAAVDGSMEPMDRTFKATRKKTL